MTTRYAAEKLWSMALISTVYACIVIVVPSKAALGQGSILHATVADANTGVFILDAEVKVDPPGLKAATDYFGDARFAKLAAGDYKVQARHLGYAPLETTVRISGRDSLEIVLLMVPVSQALPAVTIEAAATSPFLKEFEERRHQGNGYFITESDLLAAHGSALENIVASKIPGITIRGGPGPGRIVYSTRGSNSIRKALCLVAVYWNGVRVGSDPTIVPLEFIGGIEYYTPAYAPVQYREPGNDCGVMLLWPRS